MRGEGDRFPTPIQGQYLAFIHYYTKIHGRPPAQAEIVRYFRVRPPSVLSMLRTLEARGFIAREPGQPRSMQILIPRASFPDLE